MIPTVVFQNLDKLKYLLTHNSPAILTGVGIGGTVATAYLTGRASFKAAEIINQEEGIIIGPADFQGPDVSLSTTDKVKLVWKLYIPPVGVGATTVTAIFAANRISSKRMAALALASGLSERALQEYKDKVVEKLGKNQDQKVRDEIAKDRVDQNPVHNTEVIITGGGDVLCFDSLTGRYFQSTVENIKRAENHVNFQINQHDYCSLSAFHEAVGLDATTLGDTVGFNIDNHCDVAFSTVMSSDNRPCIVVDFKRMPVADYDKIGYRG